MLYIVALESNTITMEMQIVIIVRIDLAQQQFDYKWSNGCMDGG